MSLCSASCAAMPLIYRNTHHGYHVRLGYYFGHSVLDTMTSWVWRDFVLRALAGSLFDLGWYPVEPGRRVFFDHGVPQDVILRGPKPSRDEYDAIKDSQRYGSTFTNAISGVGHVLRGESFYPFVPGRENNVRHATYSGNVGPSFAGSLRKSHSGDFEYVTLHTSELSKELLLPRYATVDGFNVDMKWLHTGLEAYSDLAGWIYQLASPEVFDWAPRRDFLVTAQNLRDVHVAYDGLHVAGVFDWGAVHEVYTTNLVIDTSDRNIAVSYDTTWTYDVYGSPSYTGWHTRISFPSYATFLQPQYFETGGHSDGYQLVGPVVKINRTVTLVGASTNDWFGPVSVGSHADQQFSNDFAWFTSEPSFSAEDGFTDRNLTDFTRRAYWYGFSKAVDSVASDIRFSSFLSTNDAIEEAIASLNTDVYQTFAKLGGVLDQIPDVERALHGLASLARGKPIESIADALDFLTEVRLQHQFEWRSEFDLLSDQLPKIRDIVSTINALSRNEDVVCRGTFHYDFPQGEFGRKESKLITRSRLVVGRNSFVSLTNLLNMRALGVLPSPSVGWDLIPFSFVVNWFTGIGPRIRDLESSAFVLSMYIKVFTHSYLMTSPLQSSELALSGLDMSSLPGSHPPLIRYYVREVSSLVPRIGVGRYDFRLPTRLPNWATAGSLAWQVLLSGEIV
jgi:hypothetical protein